MFDSSGLRSGSGSRTARRRAEARQRARGSPRGRQLDGAGRAPRDRGAGSSRPPGRASPTSASTSPGDEHRVDPGALELLDVLRELGELGDRELAGRDVAAGARAGGRAAPARRPPALRRAGQDLRVDVLEHVFQLVLVAARGRRTRARARDSARRARRTPSSPSAGDEHDGVDVAGRAHPAAGRTRAAARSVLAAERRVPRRRGLRRRLPAPPARLRRRWISTSTEIPSPSAIA